jgi:serine protease Do
VLVYDGRDIPDASTLRNDVANTTIGQEVSITVWRDKKKVEIHVKVGNLEEMTQMLKASLKERLGVEVRPVTIQDIEKYGATGTPEGLVIQWLDSKGPLGKVGFETGDIILAVNGQPITDLESFAAMVSSLPHNQKITLLALDHRTGQTAQVEVEVE